MQAQDDYFIQPNKTNDIGYKRPFQIASFERNVMNLTHGTWTMLTQTNEEIQTENIKEFEGLPGKIITNSVHDFGFKYNSLYNTWKFYDFKNKRFM
jgi:hypothetical protein